MTKLDDAKLILKLLEVPNAQQADICAYSFLSLLSVGEDTEWVNSKNEWIRIHDILAFIKDKYDVEYAENSRETVRKKAMHPFRDAAFIEDNGKPTNSPNYRYRITEELLNLIKQYGTSEWDVSLSKFKSNHNTLIEIYSSKKKHAKNAC